jgi:hypothetical protein
MAKACISPVKYLLLIILFTINGYSTSYYYYGSYYYYQGIIKYCGEKLSIDTLKVDDRDKLENIKDCINKMISMNNSEKIKGNLYFKMTITENKAIDSLKPLNDFTSEAFKLNNIDKNCQCKLNSFNQNDSLEIDLTYDNYKEKVWKESDKVRSLDNLSKTLWVIGSILSIILTIVMIGSYT